MKRVLAALLALFLLPCVAVRAQNLPNTSSPVAGESREVIAEGRAAIDFESGGVAAAKEAAKRLALRNAVERVAGVYVSARTLTQNYQMIRDQVSTRSDALAVPIAVLREDVGVQDVRVVLRAKVFVRPLAEQIRALGLARAWRVKVVSARGASIADGALSEVERALIDAGFSVVEVGAPADLTVTIAPSFTSVAERELQTAAGVMTMHTIRGEITLRAARTETGEIVASVAGTDTAMHISAQTARSQCVAAAASLLAPRLADSLLVLPASASQPVLVRASGLTSINDVDKLEESLIRVGGVQNVVRRGYSGGRAEFEVDLLVDAAIGFGRELEKLGLSKTRTFKVVSESRGRIEIAVRKTAK